MAYNSYYVYLLSNKSNSVLYVGITNDLQRRLWEHKSGLDPKSFTSKYKTNKLLWWEEHNYIDEAIAREKQLKSGSRARKIALIEGNNPHWMDLAADWYE